MKLKPLVVTVAVLVVLSAIVFLSGRSGRPLPADARTGQPLVDRALVEKSARLRISDQGKTLVLVRQPDGSWSVSGYFDLPADFAKLTAFVASLTDTKLERLVTSSPERIARLGFGDTKIELLDSGGKELWSVSLGRDAETGGGRYLRFGAEPKAWLARLNLWLDTEPKNWADAQLLNLKPEDIARVEIPFAETGPVVVQRAKKDDAWTANKTPAGQRVNAGKIAGMLGAVGHVRFSDALDPADAGVAVAKAHERVFRLTTFDGKTYTVAMGRKPEEKKPRAPVVATTPPTTAVSPAQAVGNPAPVAPLPAAPPKASAPAAPEYDTIPAGPVFVFISSSDPAAPVNAAMQKRAFQVFYTAFTGLPQTAAELFEAIPPAPAKG